MPKRACSTTIMKRHFVFVFIVLALTYCSNTGNAQVTLSAITFGIRNIGIGTGGSIGGLVTKIHFSPANLNSSTIEASVDVNTINTDNSSRDEHLRSEDFFDVLRYPKITLKSVALKHKSGNSY